MIPLATFLGLDLNWDLYTISTVAMLFFMGALVYLLWRTLKLLSLIHISEPTRPY